MTFSLSSSHSKAYFTHFGETLTWHPFGGVAREIIGVVDRNQPQQMGDAAQSLRASLVIAVRNSATSTDDDEYGGIAMSELTGDGMARSRIEVAQRIGGTAVERRPIRIVDEDEGVLRLEVA